MIKLGTTYSHRHIGYLKLNGDKAFDGLLGFEFDIVRLCCYWDEIQPKKDTFDFSKIKILLEKCEKAKQDVVLTLGMKAPRWPEFYIPSWVNYSSITEVKPYVFNFLQKAVCELKDYNCIKYYQVENEPLDSIGPKRLSIPINLLIEEINLVREMDKRKPIILSFAVNELSARMTFPKMLKIADIIGIDIYYKIPFLKHFYLKPFFMERTIKSVINKSQKPVWVTELQAEPWEHGQIFCVSAKPRSMNSDILKENYKKALDLNPSAILFWGYEYWYWKKLQGDDNLWNSVKSILNQKVVCNF